MNCRAASGALAEFLEPSLSVESLAELLEELRRRGESA
jgi:hypothetical protein